MLTRLAISNFATIDSLEIEFEDGFTVLTGETGAGKSILVDAIRLLLGGKASADLIRTGENKIIVEAVFDISAQAQIGELFAEMEVPTNGELILRRAISSNGRSRILANDTQITIGRLDEIAPYLINIHGQHDNEMLLNSSTHLDFLDGFADLIAERDRFGELFRQYASASRERDELRREAEHKQARIQSLQQQIEDIRTCRPSTEEEAGLLREHIVLTHSEQLLALTGTFGSGLYESEQSVIDRLGELSHTLGKAAEIDKTLHPMVQQLEPIRYQLEELHRTVRSYAAGLESDPLRLDAVNARLAELERIKRRYGGIEDALKSLEDGERELAAIEASDTKLAQLEQSLGKLAKGLHFQAKTLTQHRKQASTDFGERIMAELRELGMEKVVFDLKIVSRTAGPGKAPQYTAKGAETVEFLLSNNPGQSPRPLSRIASGGELSRTMLGLKSIVAQSDPTCSLVFDEVDAGVSGATAEIVGRKLRALGRTHQVLCITHLPQIAAQSDHHLRVEKTVRNHQTFTAVDRLDEDERVREVARLLSGIEVSEKSLASAQELVHRAQQSQF